MFSDPVEMDEKYPEIFDPHMTPETPRELNSDSEPDSILLDLDDDLLDSSLSSEDDDANQYLQDPPDPPVSGNTASSSGTIEESYFTNMPMSYSAPSYNLRVADSNINSRQSTPQSPPPFFGHARTLSEQARISSPLVTQKVLTRSPSMSSFQAREILLTFSDDSDDQWDNNIDMANSVPKPNSANKHTLAQPFLQLEAIKLVPDFPAEWPAVELESEHTRSNSNSLGQRSVSEPQESNMTPESQTGLEEIGGAFPVESQPNVNEGSSSTVRVLGSSSVEKPKAENSSPVNSGDDPAEENSLLSSSASKSPEILSQAFDQDVLSHEHERSVSDSNDTLNPEKDAFCRPAATSYVQPESVPSGENLADLHPPSSDMNASAHASSEPDEEVASPLADNSQNYGFCERQADDSGLGNDQDQFMVDESISSLNLAAAASHQRPVNMKIESDSPGQARPSSSEPVTSLLSQYPIESAVNESLIESQDKSHENPKTDSLQSADSNYNDNAQATTSLLNKKSNEPQNGLDQTHIEAVKDEWDSHNYERPLEMQENDQDTRDNDKISKDGNDSAGNNLEDKDFSGQLDASPQSVTVEVEEIDIPALSDIVGEPLSVDHDEPAALMNEPTNDPVHVDQLEELATAEDLIPDNNSKKSVVDIGKQNLISDPVAEDQNNEPVADIERQNIVIEPTSEEQSNEPVADIEKQNLISEPLPEVQINEPAADIGKQNLISESVAEEQSNEPVADIGRQNSVTEPTTADQSQVTAADHNNAPEQAQSEDSHSATLKTSAENDPFHKDTDEAIYEEISVDPHVESEQDPREEDSTFNSHTPSFDRQSSKPRDTSDSVEQDITASSEEQMPPAPKPMAVEYEEKTITDECKEDNETTTLVNEGLQRVGFNSKIEKTEDDEKSQLNEKINRKDDAAQDIVASGSHQFDNTDMTNNDMDSAISETPKLQHKGRQTINLISSEASSKHDPSQTDSTDTIDDIEATINRHFELSGEYDPITPQAVSNTFSSPQKRRAFELPAVAGLITEALAVPAESPLAFQDRLIDELFEVPLDHHIDDNAPHERYPVPKTEIVAQETPRTGGAFSFFGNFLGQKTLSTPESTDELPNQYNEKHIESQLIGDENKEDRRTLQSFENIDLTTDAEKQHTIVQNMNQNNETTIWTGESKPHIPNKLSTIEPREWTKESEQNQAPLKNPGSSTFPYKDERLHESSTCPYMDEQSHESVAREPADEFASIMHEQSRDTQIPPQTSSPSMDIVQELEQLALNDKEANTRNANVETSVYLGAASKSLEDFMALLVSTKPESTGASNALSPSSSHSNSNSNVLALEQQLELQRATISKLRDENTQLKLERMDLLDKIKEYEQGQSHSPRPPRASGEPQKPVPLVSSARPVYTHNAYAPAGLQRVSDVALGDFRERLMAWKGWQMDMRGW